MSNSPSSSPSPIDIQALLTAFDSSGQSAAAFARANGLPTWKIYNALERRRGKVRARRTATRAQCGALLPVKVTEPALPAHATVQPAALELLLAGGHRLLIGADFDARLLRRVLEALRAC